MSSRSAACRPPERPEPPAPRCAARGPRALRRAAARLPRGRGLLSALRRRAAAPCFLPKDRGARVETYFQQVFFFFNFFFVVVLLPPSLFFGFFFFFSPLIFIFLISLRVNCFSPSPLFRCAALDMRRLLQPCWWIFFLKITSSVLHDVVCFPGE